MSWVHRVQVLQPSAHEVAVTVSGLPDTVTAEAIDTEVVGTSTLVLKILDVAVHIALPASIDADSCTVKLRRRQGQLHFSARIAQDQAAYSTADAVGTRGAGSKPSEVLVSPPVTGPAADAENRDAVCPKTVDCRYLALALSKDYTTLQRKFLASEAARAKEQAKVDALLQEIVNALGKTGYAVCDNFLSPALVSDMREELSVMELFYTPGLIWVGKESQAGAQISVSDVRGDVVLWLDGQALGATAFIKDGVKRQCGFMRLAQALAQVDSFVFDHLRQRVPALNHLHKRSDAMMAIYPSKGARFAKHVDNTTRDGRRLTVVIYLNPGWQEDQGGALRLAPVREGCPALVDVLPLCGRIAMFYSDEVAHEVMPSWAMRHAITLWYYDAVEHAEALAAGQSLTSDPLVQAEARDVLRDMLVDTVPADEDGCKHLAERVRGLSPAALAVVAAVTGAPSAQQCMEQMRSLTPERLAALREELRNMGLAEQHHAPDTSAHVV